MLVLYKGFVNIANFFSLADYVSIVPHKTVSGVPNFHTPHASNYAVKKPFSQ